MSRRITRHDADDIVALLDRARQHATANATDVKCPTCGAAAGFYCRVPNTTTRTDAPHAERV